MITRRSRLRRAALVLALLVLAAIVTAVAASATSTAVPRQLTGSWSTQDGFARMFVSPRGKVKVYDLATNYYRFSHITADKLSISGTLACSGTGRYRWKITNGRLEGNKPFYVLRIKKIHDACQDRGVFTRNMWLQPRP
jgi:hypothetical protein